MLTQMEAEEPEDGPMEEEVDEAGEGEGLDESHGSAEPEGSEPNDGSHAGGSREGSPVGGSPQGSKGGSEGGDEEGGEGWERRQAEASLARRDAVMESGVVGALTAFLRSGGQPEELVRLLSGGYAGEAQLCNLLAEWLVAAGAAEEEVAGLMEDQLAVLLTKHFSARAADAIFEAADSSGIDWLPQLISHPRWRRLVYALADSFPHCLMLNFAVKLISDAGFQHEISSVTTAAQQLEIFSRVLVSSLKALLGRTPHTREHQTALQELLRVASHSEYTFLYTASLLHILGRDKGQRAAALAIFEQLQEAVAGRRPGLELPEALGSGQDTSQACLALSSLALPNPALRTAMQAMLTKRALNPADVGLLHDYYRQTEPPPVGFLRNAEFLRLLVRAVFLAGAEAVAPAHKHKYVYLLCYASVVGERGGDARRRREVEEAAEAVDEVSALCQGKGDTSGELLGRLAWVFEQSKRSVVAAGLLEWVAAALDEANFFQLHPEPVPIHLALVDEVVSLHPNLHPEVFRLLSRLMGRVAGDLERSRMLVDRFVHLLWHGFVIPVVGFLGQLYADGGADTSLLRYFVTETLEVVGPPYSAELRDVLAPLLKDPDILDPAAHPPPVTAFLQHL